MSCEVKLLRGALCCTQAPATLPTTPTAALHTGEVSRVSMQLLAALSSRLRSGATAPSLDLIQRLALSASVPVRWWPKALRAAADEELGQSTQPEAPLCRPELLQMVGSCMYPAKACLVCNHGWGEDAMGIEEVYKTTCLG